jgi:mono/diheme cytochrome c family protein
MSFIGIAIGGSLLVFLMGPVLAQEKKERQRVPESTQGPVLYKTHCAVCHGTQGNGGGPIARFLKVQPRDLTRLAGRNGGKFPLARVQKLISGEVELPAGHGTSSMPVWGPLFSEVAWDQDLGRVRIYNLAKYIETLQK